MPLEGKIAIVTGASRGIGRAVAFTLAKNGARVATVARSLAPLEELAQEIEKEGGVALPMVADVTIKGQVEAMVDRVMESLRWVDILVNNAGVEVSGLLHTFEEKDFDTVADTNLKGVFLCTKAVLPSMIERKRGHIINIASVSGLRGWAEDGAYCASKWGVLGLSESLDKEVRKHGIKVSCICPGSVDTNLIDKWIGPEDPRRSLLLRPKDIANAVLYIASQPPNMAVNQLVIHPMVETLYSDYLPIE